MRLVSGYLCALFLLLSGCMPNGEKHSEKETYLLLSQKGAKSIRENIDNPLISKAFNASKSLVEDALQSEVVVPIPQDPGGGYTHEKHKANYTLAKEAGTLFLITGTRSYFELTKTLLLKYADLYPTLGLHPQRKNQGPGKLFWQVLNEEVALVYFIQAFDAIKGDLTSEEYNHIVEGLIDPMVTFIKDDSRATFTKIHNHALWGVAGVGMAGIVLKNDDWLLSSLYGPEQDSNCGYFKMLNSLFSPDGYYSEGPYYQRYALMPVVVLAQSLEQNRKEFRVVEFKDSLVVRAIKTTYNLSTCSGDFFPLNDAIKAKAITTPEMGYALPFVYASSGHQSVWIDAITQNGNLVLTDAVAELGDIASPYQRRTQFINDGPNGEKGGLSIFRSSGDCSGITSLLKFGTHGMGHGHFDQLGIQVYVHGKPFLADYGASRFHNIPQKEGGRYLKENNTWANQSVAHNTMVVNQESQHGGNDKTADRSQSHLIQNLFSDSISYTVALDSMAYPGSTLTRYHIMFESQDRVFIVDFQQIKSGESIDVDFPFHFEEHFVDNSPPIEYNLTRLGTLGERNGYEHLWKLGSSGSTIKSHFTWQLDDTFLTLHQSSLAPYEVCVVKTGANDPNHNLLSKEGVVLRSTNVKNQAICSVFELHGAYDTEHETTSGAISTLGEIEIKEFDDYYQVIIEGLTEMKLYKTTLAESTDLVVKRN